MKYPIELETIEIKGQKYKMMQLDKNSIKRVLITEESTSPTPSVTEEVEFDPTETPLEELSELSVPKFKKVVKTLPEEVKATLLDMEEAKDEPRKSIIKLLK